MNPFYIGDQIRLRRKALRLTQAQLAEMTGLSTAFIGHIERGTRTASFRSYMDICYHLRLSPNALIEPDVLAAFLNEPYVQK